MGAASDKKTGPGRNIAFRRRAGTRAGSRDAFHCPFCFSRLSRSTKDLLDLVERLTKMDVHLVSLKENLDTTTATGKLMLTMLSALSQFERDLIAERTIDGLKAARARGRRGGRPRSGTEKDRQQAYAMYEANIMSCQEIANKFGVSLSTLNRWIKEKKQG